MNPRLKNFFLKSLGCASSLVGVLVPKSMNEGKASHSVRPMRLRIIQGVMSARSGKRVRSVR
jgi:hypothetical protein